MSKYELTAEDFEDDAATIGCEVEAIRAVFQVESAGKGFYSDGVPRTLFEGHVFYRLTGGRWAEDYPTLCYPKWTRQFYGKTEAEERDRLWQASQLDPHAAMMACSWGLPQIMGENYALCGCVDLQAFVEQMYESANAQLYLFTQFVIRSGIARFLIAKDWSSFARHYNGPGQVEYYAGRIRDAYEALV